MTAQATRYAEDYKPGDTFDLGTYDISRDEIVEFARHYDPFPLANGACLASLDAQALHHGGSGWVTRA
jgi:hypothetical protein